MLERPRQVGAGRAINMEKILLKAKKRDVFGRKTKKERKAGMTPAVIYGKGLDSQSLWVDTMDLGKLLKKAGESTIIELDLPGNEKHNVVINEIQKDPVKGDFLHIDFFQVRMDEKIEKEIRLEFVGESPAVKEQGGILVKSLDELPIKCFPADLPSEIKVDISVLKTFDDRISVSNLKLSDKIEVLIDPETVVATVDEPRSQEELEKLEEKVEEDVTKVEGVIKEEPVVEGEEGKEAKEEKKEEKKKE
jgi:large subunit ribosomal protein L25